MIKIHREIQSVHPVMFQCTIHVMFFFQIESMYHVSIKF